MFITAQKVLSILLIKCFADMQSCHFRSTRYNPLTHMRNLFWPISCCSMINDLREYYFVVSMCKNEIFLLTLGTETTALDRRNYHKSRLRFFERREEQTNDAKILVDCIDRIMFASIELRTYSKVRVFVPKGWVITFEYRSYTWQKRKQQSSAYREDENFGSKGNDVLIVGKKSYL